MSRRPGAVTPFTRLRTVRPPHDEYVYVPRSAMAKLKHAGTHDAKVFLYLCSIDAGQLEGDASTLAYDIGLSELNARLALESLVKRELVRVTPNLNTHVVVNFPDLVAHGQRRGSCVMCGTVDDREIAFLEINGTWICEGCVDKIRTAIEEMNEALDL